MHILAQSYLAFSETPFPAKNLIRTFNLRAKICETVIFSVLLFPSSRCLRRGALREPSCPITGPQSSGKPRIQPQSHFLPEIPGHPHHHPGVALSCLLTLKVLVASCVTPSPLQVWGRGLLRDSLLGRAQLHTVEPEMGRGRAIDLRGGRARAGHRGIVYVETSSSICLTDL